MKESFIFYRSFYEAIEDLNDKEQLKVYKAIAKLALNDEEMQLTGVANTIFKLIKPQLKANNERYEKGINGGRPVEYDHEEIEDLIVQGYSNKEISGIIGCSQSTIKNFRQKLVKNERQKLDNNCRQKLDNNFLTEKTKSQKLGQKPNENVNVNDNDNVNVNVNDNYNDNYNENENVNVNVNDIEKENKEKIEAFMKGLSGHDS